MLQDLECDEVFYTKIDDVAKTKARDFIHDADAALSECHVFLWKKIQSWSQSAKNTELDDVFLAKKRNSFWIMLRKYSSNIPDIPRWEGYVFSTGIEPKRKIVISYFPVILHPITEYKTVQDCPR